MLYPAMSELLKHIDSRYRDVPYSAFGQARDARHSRGRRGQACRNDQRLTYFPLLTKKIHVLHRLMQNLPRQRCDKMHEDFQQISV